MTGFRPAPGLIQKIATEFIVPKVDDLTGRAETEARAAAPAEEVWRTVGDDAVRPTHRKANNQAVPANLRFEIDTPPSERSRGAAPTELAYGPRDPALTDGNRVNCRCQVVIRPDGLSRTIRAQPARLVGSAVVGRVVCTHPRGADAEFGAAGDPGARFMGAGLDEAASTI